MFRCSQDRYRRVCRRSEPKARTYKHASRFRAARRRRPEHLVPANRKSTAFLVRRRSTREQQERRYVRWHFSQATWKPFSRPRRSRPKWSEDAVRINSRQRFPPALPRRENPRVRPRGERRSAPVRQKASVPGERTLRVSRRAPEEFQPGYASSNARLPESAEILLTSEACRARRT